MESKYVWRSRIGSTADWSLENLRRILNVTVWSSFVLLRQLKYQPAVDTVKLYSFCAVHSLLRQPRAGVRAPSWRKAPPYPAWCPIRKEGGDWGLIWRKVRKSWLNGRYWLSSGLLLEMSLFAIALKKIRFCEIDWFIHVRKLYSMCFSQILINYSLRSNQEERHKDEKKNWSSFLSHVWPFCVASLSHRAGRLHRSIAWILSYTNTC